MNMNAIMKLTALLHSLKLSFVLQQKNETNGPYSLENEHTTLIIFLMAHSYGLWATDGSVFTICCYMSPYKSRCSVQMLELNGFSSCAGKVQDCFGGEVAQRVGRTRGQTGGRRGRILVADLHAVYYPHFPA